jgi:hypothetical protein
MTDESAKPRCPHCGSRKLVATGTLTPPVRFYGTWDCKERVHCTACERAHWLPFRECIVRGRAAAHGVVLAHPVAYVSALDGLRREL